MMRLTGKAGSERGLTLIEFAMASAVAGVMFLVLYSILNQALAAFDVGQLRSRAVQSGRVVMVRIVDDLKYAENIWVADDDRIFITRPNEGYTLTNGRPRTHLVDYSYNAASEEVTRRIDYGTNYTFTDQVAAFSLTYRDVGFVALAMPVVDVHEIRYIELELRLEDDGYVITLRNLVVLDNPVTVP